MGDDDPEGLTWSSLLSIGAGFALMIVVGVALGRWLDGLLHTSPILVLVGIALGIAGGLCFTFVRVRSVLKQ